MVHTLATSLILALYTLVSSVYAAPPRAAPTSTLAPVVLAIRPDLTQQHVEETISAMADMLVASANNAASDLETCKEVCADWNLSAVACKGPDDSFEDMITCMCKEQYIKTMAPCTDCLENQGTGPNFIQQTRDYIDVCDTFNWKLENETISASFYADDTSTLLGSTSAVPTSTMTQPEVVSSMTMGSSGNEGDDVLGGGLAQFSLSTAGAPSATRARSTEPGDRDGIAATATSISNQGPAQARGKVENAAAPSFARGGGGDVFAIAASSGLVVASLFFALLF
ncbi:hypothetical protein JCM11491_006072 [Sporobolomyces phaffii]